MKQKIKVGVLLDSGTIPAWQYHLLEQLLASNFITIDVLIYSCALVPASSKQQRKWSLYTALKRREEKTKKIAPNACESKNVYDLLPDTNEISLSEKPRIGQPDQVLEDIEGIQSCKLDAILALGALCQLDRLSEAARFGIWFFKHSYDQINCPNGSSVGFWEVIKQRPFVYSALMIRRANAPEDTIAYDSYTGVDYSSHLKTRNLHLWKILFFVPRTFRCLHRMGQDRFWRHLSAKRPTSSDLMVNRHPGLSNLDVFLPLVSYALRRLTRRIRKKFYDERWIVMFLFGDKFDDIPQYRAIQPPRGSFWADPFALYRDGAYYVFVEDVSMQDGRGKISLIQLDENGRHAAATTIIDKPYHLSYPFVFSWRNELYLLPESSANRTIEIYRCKNFPYSWEFLSNLMENVSACDATLFEHDGTWWMFTNLQAHVGASSWDELSLFYSDHPLSRKWHAHPMNPVISDVRCARPAGNIFVEDGRIYRPSQNSSVRYGFGLNINEIVELSKTAYREETVKTVKPTWNRSIRAVHTFNRTENLAVIDVIHRSRRTRTVDH